MGRVAVSAGAPHLRSGFLPRFLGVWLAVNGVASDCPEPDGPTRAPSPRTRCSLYAQPAFMGEIALMLWLLIKGAVPSTRPGLSLG